MAFGNLAFEGFSFSTQRGIERHAGENGICRQNDLACDEKTCRHSKKCCNSANSGEKRGAVIYSRFFLTRIHLADCSQTARFETFFFGHGIFISGQNCRIDQKNAIVGSRQGAAAPPPAVLREGRRGISAGGGSRLGAVDVRQSTPQAHQNTRPVGFVGEGVEGAISAGAAGLLVASLFAACSAGSGLGVVWLAASGSAAGR